MATFDDDLRQAEQWFQSPRFKGISRLYSARQVVEQRGTLPADYTVARNAAEGFHARLRELFAAKQSITTFGPYSPGQAVSMKRMGIEGIYLGGWATSAKGSLDEDPGPDLASYPLSQVPNEAAPIVRALLAADKNQHFARSRMSEEERRAHRPIDYRPFIIADADTGHGGDAHVRNLVRRFVEVGVPGYHIEDQKPGVKKCGHQDGKVLVPIDEQIKRLNSARFQLDLMGVPGLIVARTDAEAAIFLDGAGDERDHSFLLGATGAGMPSVKLVSLAILRRLHDQGVKEVLGHLLYRISDGAYEGAYDWMQRSGVLAVVDAQAAALVAGKETSIDGAIDKINARFGEAWQNQAALKTFPDAVAEAMALRIEEGAGSRLGLSIEQWWAFARSASIDEQRDRAERMGIRVPWDCELPRSPEGYYRIQGGIDYAIARSLAVAPFSDLVWMETKTANLEDADRFADALHARYPQQMLAYNLSPSFNWDTTGMTDEQMRRFPEELGKLGYVFNFITYGGHQIDGVAAEEFSTALKQDGMLALARLQRKLRLLGSPYKTPQSHVGGPRLDGALMACSGRTATTAAMGSRSTHHQHLVQTEVAPKLLEEWLEIWRAEHDLGRPLRVELRPHTAGTDLLELAVVDSQRNRLANVVFETIQDRRGRNILSVRDQNTFDTALRRKRLMTLIHLFLIHRYKSAWVHYVSPTDDNAAQTASMKAQGIYNEVQTEIGQIIVAGVNATRVAQLAASPDRAELKAFITGKAAAA
jgi:isocitrate lyase